MDRTSPDELPALLNAPTMGERISNLESLVRANRDGIQDAPVTEEANNHVHTFFSFSPYSPSYAAYMARKSGLQVVGSIDHDSISAASEMVEACKIVGIGSTVGAELRTTWYDTPFADRKINSPDAAGLAYVVLHGVPRRSWSALDAYIAPIREVRNERNRRQLDGLNTILSDISVEPLDFDEDIVPLSQASSGGSVTERHLVFGVAHRLIAGFGRGENLVRALRERLDLTVTGRLEERLLDSENPHYVYDLLGVLKSGLVPSVFIVPSEQECRPVQEVVARARELGAIPAYAYLGDVTESPTADKKAEKFEDEYLDELFDVITDIGFQAVTYMPPRNTKDQLRRVQRLCAEHGLMEISGVDINSSRQAFTCPEVLEPEFKHLNESTWALVAHEKLADCAPGWGPFGGASGGAASVTPSTRPELSTRLKDYAELGRALDPRAPERACDVAKEMGWPMSQ